MKVILKEDIKGVGKKDQIINANDGYARNYLFPKNLAVPADKGNLTNLQSKKSSEEHRKELEKEAAKQNIITNILIEVNVAGEKSKFGLMPEEVFEFTEKVSEMSHIRVKGLMTIAPYVENPEENRPVFAHLKKLSVDIAKKNVDNVNVSMLSMGMTNDYQTAIEEGATMVRVGTGIFGERDYAQV